MKIGQLAERTGIGIHTLRFYERRGLLRTPPRLASGYRDYAPQTEETVCFIKQAQQLGFALAEIKELLSLRAAPRTNATKARASAVAKLRSLDEKIAAMQHMRAELERIIINCDCGTDERPECELLAVAQPKRQVI